MTLNHFEYFQTELQGIIWYLWKISISVAGKLFSKYLSRFPIYWSNFNLPNNPNRKLSMKSESYSNLRITIFWKKTGQLTSSALWKKGNRSVKSAATKRYQGHTHEKLSQKQRKSNYYSFNGRSEKRTILNNKLYGFTIEIKKI